MKNRRFLFLSTVPPLLILVAFSLAIYAFVVRATARSILRDVYALKVGLSSVDAVEAIASRQQGFLKEHHCDGKKCHFLFEVNNTWLHRLSLEPAARFGAEVNTDDGRVSSIAVVLMRDTRVFPTSPSAGITEEFRDAPTGRGNLSAPYWFPTPVGKPYLRVDLTSQASTSQREHAYAYSLECLTKIGGGCDLPCDYLPLAWHDWQAELEKEGFGDEGFGGYYTNRGRCK